LHRTYTLKSPITKISVGFKLTYSGEPVYSIVHSDSVVLKESKLGVLRSDRDFTINLSLDSVSSQESVIDKYTLLHGKWLNCMT